MSPTRTERARVLAMVAEGRIDRAEAERLLAALGATGGRGGGDWLRPLARLGTGRGLLLGALGAAAALAVGELGVRFDGALDLHAVAGAPGWGTRLVDQLVAWPGVALVAWLVALALGTRGRFVDLLAAVGLARLPLVVAALPVGLLDPPLPDPSTGLPVWNTRLAVAAVVSVVGAVAMLLQLVFGYAHATGARGWRWGVGVGTALLTAEVLSKLLPV